MNTRYAKGCANRIKKSVAERMVDANDLMVFLPTGPGPRTARVKIIQSKRGRLFRWEFGDHRTASSGLASPLTPNGMPWQPMGGTSRSRTKRATRGTSLNARCHNSPLPAWTAFISNA